MSQIPGSKEGFTGIFVIQGREKNKHKYLFGTLMPPSWGCEAAVDFDPVAPQELRSLGLHWVWHSVPPQGSHGQPSMYPPSPGYFVCSAGYFVCFGHHPSSEERGAWSGEGEGGRAGRDGAAARRGQVCCTVSAPHAAAGVGCRKAQAHTPCAQTPSPSSPSSPRGKSCW